VLKKDSLISVSSLFFLNHKLFFKFQHLILKLTDPNDTSPRPYQDFIGPLLGPSVSDRNFPMR
jgi:hypothetical protein